MNMCDKKHFVRLPTSCVSLIIGFEMSYASHTYEFKNWNIKLTRLVLSVIHHVFPLCVSQDWVAVMIDNVTSPMDGRALVYTRYRPRNNPPMELIADFAGD